MSHAVPIWVCIQPPKSRIVPFQHTFRLAGTSHGPWNIPSPLCSQACKPDLPQTGSPHHPWPATDFVRRAPTAILCPVFVLGNFTAIFYSLAALEAVCKCGVEKVLRLTEPGSQVKPRCRKPCRRTSSSTFDMQEATVPASGSVIPWPTWRDFYSAVRGDARRPALPA